MGGAHPTRAEDRLVKVQDVISKSEILTRKERTMESLKKLVGEKVTIWKSSELGFGWSKKGVITEVEFGPYAQYEQAAFICFKPHRARKVRKLVLLPGARFMVWKGYHDVDTSIFGEEQKHGGVTVQKSKALSSSSFWMEQAAGSVSTRPFYMQG